MKTFVVARGAVIVGALLTSLSQPVLAQTQTQTQPEADGGKAMGFLIPVLVQAAQAAVGNGAQSLFSNFINWLTRPANCALGAEGGNAQYGYQQPYGSAYGQGYGMGMPMPQQGGGCNKPGGVDAGGQNNNVAFNQPAVPLNTNELQQLSNQPAVAIQILKYSGKDTSVPPLETLKLGSGGDLRFNIRTGEHFAMKFDTSVPGRVRLVNTDANGKVENVGNYEVIGNSENRMPRKTNIEMIGAPGNETLDVIFTPCVSAVLLGDPRVAQFKPYLPACSDEAASKQLSPVAMQRVDAGKGMGNSEAMQSTTTALLAAPEATTKGAPLMSRIYVNHEGGAGNSAPTQGVVSGNL